MPDLDEIQIKEVAVLTIEQIREKIKMLSETETGEPLNFAMTKLKAALKDNPAACELMLPEDMGACVAALMRMTNRNIMIDLGAEGKKKTTAPKVKYTKEDLDNLTAEDLGL